VKKGEDMRKIPAIIFLMIWLCGCGAPAGPAEAPDVPPPAEVPAEMLELEALRVELSREGMDAQTLLSVVQALPDQLKEALAAHGVAVKTVTATIGSAPAATLQAMEQGNVDLAFLPAASYTELESETRALLAAGAWGPDLEEDADWNGDLAGTALEVGEPVLVCAAPTEYGRNLSQRSSCSWTELEHARWGVLEADSVTGYQMVNLWLADHYEGNTCADLPRVTVYESEEALLRAAAAGEIDLLALTAGTRQIWAEDWESALGGTGTLWESLPVLALAGRVYERVAVVRPTEILEDPRFGKALAAALTDLQDAGSGAAFGLARYAPVEEDALDPMRRMAVLAS
jgi:ABC-type phosphate/phosphonate transport system substrate-binding protein